MKKIFHYTISIIAYKHIKNLNKIKNNMINKNSKILITGGSGLVGQNLTNRLYKEGYKNLRVNLHVRDVRNNSTDTTIDFRITFMLMQRCTRTVGGW